MHYLILVTIGTVMGIFGGLLGIGGSVIMIPAMVLAFGLTKGNEQHLYQASAMICNFFVAVSAAYAHKREKVLMWNVVKHLAPAGVVGVVLGVMLSNSSFFLGDRGYLLAKIFGIFMIYVIFHNCARFFHNIKGKGAFDVSGVRRSSVLTIIVGLISGIAAGLLGIGGGSVCVPLQQVALKMPLKRAIGNSAATIILIAVIGACLKNATLAQHNIAVTESLKIAAVVIPTAIIGGFLGARLMHILPKNVVRTVFVLLMIVASYKMLTVARPG